MMKKIISAILALAMLLSMTACAQDSTSDSSSASDSSYLDSDYENSSESDADSSSASGSDSSSENSADDSSTVTSETTSTTSDTTTTTENSTATTTTKAQATTTTKQAVATTKATIKSVQTTKATVRTTAKATTKATVKTTPKATQPAVNTAAYVNNIIADINKMFPESQFNKALYDKFERLCKGIPTSDDLYQIKEQLCNFAMRKYSGKKGTFTYYQGITPTPRTSTVTAAKPISITIGRTLGENDAHQNNGAMVNTHYSNKKTVEQNYKGIGSFIKKCYCMADRGVPALIKTCDNQNPNISYKHTIYIFIGKGIYNSTIGHYDYYLWFCEGERL